MASANFTVNGSASPPAAEVSAGSTVTLALTSTTGVRTVQWSIVGSHAPGASTPTITPAGSPSGVTATFVMPNVVGGQGYLVQAVVNGGVDDSGAEDSALVKRAIVGVVDGLDTVPFVANETLERNATHGATEELNAIRAAAGGGPVDDEDDPGIPAVRLAIDTNIANLAAFSVTQQAVTLVEGDAVLLTAQSTGAENTTYTLGTVAGGNAPLTERDDAIVVGSTVFVQEGTYGGELFVLADSNSWEPVGAAEIAVGVFDMVTRLAPTDTAGPVKKEVPWYTDDAAISSLSTGNLLVVDPIALGFDSGVCSLFAELQLLWSDNVSDHLSVACKMTIAEPPTGLTSTAADSIGNLGYADAVWQSDGANGARVHVTNNRALAVSVWGFVRGSLVQFA